jgi:hypothetical protein
MISIKFSRLARNGSLHKLILHLELLRMVSLIMMQLGKRKLQSLLIVHCHLLESVSCACMIILVLLHT